MDITDEEFENIIKNLTVRQQKLLRVLKESGELDGLVEMMEKIKLEEQEVQEEILNHSRQNQPVSGPMPRWIWQDQQAFTGTSDESWTKLKRALFKNSKTI